MSKLISIGEMLIDFTGTSPGSLSGVAAFEKNPGGAPANVAVCVARLGGSAMMITKLGEDGFGDYLLETLSKNGVDTSSVIRTKEANTPLAFVTLDEKGERDFAFYRNPSSDLLLESGEIKPEIFTRGDILHFGSVDLVGYPVKRAHETAITYALNAGMLISFDPNLRLRLWNSADNMIKAVKEFIPFCHILKMNAEELNVLTGGRGPARGLFTGNVRVIIITDGENGAELHFRDSEPCRVPAVKAVQIDSTGAGDAFAGALLFQLLRDKITPEKLSGGKEALIRYAGFAARAAAICVSRRGAIPAMPLYDEVFSG